MTIPFGRFLGYDRGEDGNLVINPEQAKLVRRIYGMFLLGKSTGQIAKSLTDEGMTVKPGESLPYFFKLNVPIPVQLHK